VVGDAASVTASVDFFIALKEIRCMRKCKKTPHRVTLPRWLTLLDSLSLYSLTTSLQDSTRTLVRGENGVFKLFQVMISLM
jgi:hypothetical protein